MEAFIRYSTPRQCSVTILAVVAYGHLYPNLVTSEPRTATRVAEFGERRPRQIAGEPRQQSIAVFGDRDKLENEWWPVTATATKMCRRLRHPRQISKSGAAGIGDREKKVPLTSATTTNFRVKGGRYRQPRQKKCRRLRQMRQKSANFIAEVGEGCPRYAYDQEKLS